MLCDVGYLPVGGPAADSFSTRLIANSAELTGQWYRFNGKEKRLSFGAYPAVTLAQARERRLDARRLLGNDVDPGEIKKHAKRAAVVAGSNTFEAVARE